jgi:hypothetical protein
MNVTYGRYGVRSCNQAELTKIILKIIHIFPKSAWIILHPFLPVDFLAFSGINSY